MMKVGIVMPCINLWEKYTRPAIDSVNAAIEEAKKHNIECRFLLIDNASIDETEVEASKMVSGSFSYHRNTEMWGFQKSVNYGIHDLFDWNAPACNYVLVLNNDIEMHKDAIVRLVERFEKGGVGMVTCLDVRGECRNDPAMLAGIDKKEKEKCPESNHPNFSAFMVNRECWEKVGEFDEVFFPAYYEDNDFHHRMNLAEVKAVCYPSAMFLHYGSRTQNEALGRPLTNSGNQHARYVAKWGGDPGVETFNHPYNLVHKGITSVKQNSI